MPVNVFAREVGKLGNTQAGVKECPDNEALLIRLACCGQAVGFIWGQWLAFVLVGHIDMVPRSVTVGCMDTDGSKEMVELERRRNEMYAKWVKEVALLLLAAMVVHNVVAGISVTDPVVVVGGVISLVMYYQAKRLVEKV